MALLLVEEALAQIVTSARPLPIEQVPLAKAFGRVLARDVLSKRDQPPFHASAMDGYAVIHADVASPGTKLEVTGVAAAGHPFRQSIRPGESVRIFTGAPLPKNADTVVIQENCLAEGRFVIVQNPTAQGRNVRWRGLDFRRQEVLVAKGTKLNARDIGACASGGHANVTVRRKARVVLIATGDELVLPGKVVKTGQIMSSNSFALAAYATACGADVLDLGIVKDNVKRIQAAIRKAARADVLITTGGASVGDHDLVQASLRTSGVKIAFWKIAMRPGKPFMFGRKGKLRVLGLPGNPVAALVCARLFLRPLLLAMSGLPNVETHRQAMLQTALPANDQRQDYMRAVMSLDAGGQLVVTPISKQDSSMQLGMRKATCLIVRPPNAPMVAVGELVPIIAMDDGL